MKGFTKDKKFRPTGSSRKLTSEELTLIKLGGKINPRIKPKEKREVMIKKDRFYKYWGI